MNKKKVIVVVAILLSIVFLSGCQEETVESGIPDNITLESDIVELVYAEIVEHMEYGNVKQVDVQYLFKNIVDRRINFYVTAEFYDAENNSLFTDSRTFTGILEGHVETVVSPTANVISFNDVNASKVDHVLLKTEEFDL